jgi:ribosomal protein S6--L-glutamate ligase
VRSSNGETEMRFVVRTLLRLGGRAWPIEITLTNREGMELPMLIGREALAGRALVDAEKSWMLGAPDWNASPGRALAARRSAPLGGRR